MFMFPLGILQNDTCDMYDAYKQDQLTSANMVMTLMECHYVMESPVVSL